MNRDDFDSIVEDAAMLAAMALVANKVDKYVKQQARNTVAENASHDAKCVGYRRVASPGACDYCKAAADEGVLAKGDGGSFHAGCGCQNEPVFGDKRVAGDASSRAASSIPFEGTFGESTALIRKAYAGIDDESFAQKALEVFNARNGGVLEFEGDLGRLGNENLIALLSGIEYGGKFVGTKPSSVKLVSSKKLVRGALAQAERRSGGDVVIRVNTARLRNMTQDQVEQVAFHEMAHTAEYRIVSDSQFAKETERLIEFQKGTRRSLPASAASKRLEQALREGGLEAEYTPNYGKIRLIGHADRTLRKLPRYAWSGADKGMQDSELIAEAFRFVAVNGYGKNEVADITVDTFLGR